MTRLELQTSGVGSNRSTNWATTTARGRAFDCSKLKHNYIFQNIFAPNAENKFNFDEDSQNFVDVEAEAEAEPGWIKNLNLPPKENVEKVQGGAKFLPNKFDRKNVVEQVQIDRKLKQVFDNGNIDDNLDVGNSDYNSNNNEDSNANYNSNNKFNIKKRSYGDQQSLNWDSNIGDDDSNNKFDIKKRIYVDRKPKNVNKNNNNAIEATIL